MTDIREADGRIYRTVNEPGSPRGQPAWGGGSERDKASLSVVIEILNPLATARGSVSVVRFTDLRAFSRSDPSPEAPGYSHSVRFADA